MNYQLRVSMEMWCDVIASFHEKNGVSFPVFVNLVASLPVYMKTVWYYLFK